MQINQSSFTNRIRAFAPLVPKLLLFLPLGIILVVIDYKVGQIPNSYSVKSDFIKNNGSQIELLILGDSGAYYGVNPKQIQCYFGFNLAQNTQTIIVNSKLALRFRHQLQSLKAVLFVFDTATFEYAIAPRDRMLRRYYGISQYESRLEDALSYSALLSFGRFLRRMIFINNFSNPYLADLSPEGWLQNEEGKEVKPELMSKKRQLFEKKIISDKAFISNLKDFKGHDIHSANLKWLNLALDELDKDVRIYFIVPPMHPEYLKYQNPATLVYSKEQLQNIVKQRKNVNVLPTAPDELFDKYDFNDPEHLSRSGAIKFSNYLNEQLCK